MNIRYPIAVMISVVAVGFLVSPGAALEEKASGNATEASVELPPREPLVKMPADVEKVVIPLTRADTWLCTKVEVDGKDAGWFVIDTGCADTIIDKQVAEQLRLKAVGQYSARAVTKTIDIKSVSYQALRVGLAKIERGIAGVTDLSSLSAFAGFKLSGLLGGEFLKANPLTLDFRDASLIIYKRDKFISPVGITTQKLEFRSRNVPAVFGDVEGKKGWFELDTGYAGGFTLGGSFVRLHFDLSGMHSFRDVDIDVTGSSDDIRGFFGPIEILEKNYKQVLTSCNMSDVTNKLTTAGSIGAGMMRDGRFTFDYEGKKLWVEWPKPEGREEMLMRLGNPKERDLKGRTPLMTAAELGRVDVVAALLEQGADVNAKDNGDVSVLMLAISGHNMEVLKLLLKKGAKIDEQMVLRAYAPLHLAVSGGFLESVKALLAGGANVNVKDTLGHTPLFPAAEANYPEIVKALLEAGADVKIKDKHGLTPLTWAAGIAKPEIIEMLLAHGAEINPDVITPLHGAAAGNLAGVKILLAHGAKVDISDPNGMTPLMWAARAGREDIVRLLVSKGADVAAKSISGKTAAEYAADPGTLRELVFAK